MPKNFLNDPNFASLPRGLRNNNPGNIMASYDWQGMIGQDDRGFAIFKDISWGLRALAIDLSTKMRNGYDTIEEIIFRYAPPTENDTEAYINAVCYYTGFSRDDFLTDKPATLSKLIRAIMNVELGKNYADEITDSDINEGLNLMESGSITTTEAAVGFGGSVLLFGFALVLLATMPKAKKSS